VPGSVQTGKRPDRLRIRCERASRQPQGAEGLRRRAGAGAGALLVTALDEVAWLLNLRGGDVPYNPVFVSYALLTHDAATLYIDAGKVGPPRCV